MSSNYLPVPRPERPAWNKGRIIGQMRPLLPKHVWSIRVRLDMADNLRDLALFNMAVDSKLRGCDLVCLKVRDVFAAGKVKERASVTQSMTGKPVRFEITETTRQSLERWIGDPEMLGWSISGPAVSIIVCICRRASMLASCANGLRRSGSSRAPMGHIRCAGRRWRRSTKGRATCVRFSFCWATPKWTAQFDTSASILTMR